jgi:REase_DpnII-MboI
MIEGGASVRLDVLAALTRRVAEAIHSADLDAHVAALVLRSGHAHPALAPFGAEIAGLLFSTPRGTGGLARSHDVAVAGCRLALGNADIAVDEFRDAARRELRRQPLPPAATVFDDDRLLVGLAAGIGRATPDIAPELVASVRRAREGADIRAACLDLWSEALARCGGSFDADLSRRIVVVITTALATPVTLRVTDRIALVWLAARLLEAGDGLADADLDMLASVASEGQQSVLELLSEIDGLRSLDAVLCFDTMSRTPATSIARRCAIDSVLAIIDAFPRSVAVLAHRYDHRTPFPVDDEYDVQDLLHALLVPVLPDCVREDPAAKIAGKSSKLDFTSKRHRLGIETKFVRDAKHAPKVREELLIDEATYHAHRFVDTVIAFVYDPRQAMPIHGDHVFETDLSQEIQIDKRTIRYITRVRR